MVALTLAGQLASMEDWIRGEYVARNYFQERADDARLKTEERSLARSALAHQERMIKAYESQWAQLRRRWQLLEGAN